MNIRQTQKDRDQTGLDINGTTCSFARFDYVKALDNVLGDEEIFREITELLLQELPKNLLAIRQGIENKDGSALERAAHSLKGSLGHFGAEEAYVLAYRLERLGNQGALAMAPAVFSKLEKALEDLAQELKFVLKRMKHENPDR